mgnify:CR=1 FL=1
MPSLHFIGEVLPVKQYTTRYTTNSSILNNQFFFIFIVLFLFGVFFLSFSLFFSYVHIYVHVSLMDQILCFIFIFITFFLFFFLYKQGSNLVYLFFARVANNLFHGVIVFLRSNVFVQFTNLIRARVALKLVAMMD